MERLTTHEIQKPGETLLRGGMSQHRAVVSPVAEEHHPNMSSPRSLYPSRFDHDFSRIATHTDRRMAPFGLEMTTTYGAEKKICAERASDPSNQSEGPTVRAISGSGSGTVATTYTPEAKDKSSKIVFIQVMRELLDGVPTKPSVIAPAFAYQDADTTSDFYHVDYVSGERDPYYNGDDSGDIGIQGNAISTPKVSASCTDTPSFADGSFPAGSSKLRWEFRTAALSAAGADQGTYYGYSDWVYAKDKGLAASTSLTGTSNAGPGSKFEDAVSLWNTNHGFSIGAVLVGAGLGGLVGAGIGFAVGGPLGALVGGLIGLGVGALVGAFAG